METLECCVTRRKLCKFSLWTIIDSSATWRNNFLTSLPHHPPPIIHKMRFHSVCYMKVNRCHTKCLFIIIMSCLFVCTHEQWTCGLAVIFFYRPFASYEALLKLLHIDGFANTANSHFARELFLRWASQCAKWNKKRNPTLSRAADNK